MAVLVPAPAGDAAEGYGTVDEVVLAEKSDLCLLGVRTLEGFGVMVDNVGHRFVAVTTVAAKNTLKPTR